MVDGFAVSQLFPDMQKYFVLHINSDKMLGL